MSYVKIVSETDTLIYVGKFGYFYKAIQLENRINYKNIDKTVNKIENGVQNDYFIFRRKKAIKNLYSGLIEKEIFDQFFESKELQNLICHDQFYNRNNMMLGYVNDDFTIYGHKFPKEKNRLILGVLLQSGIEMYQTHSRKIIIRNTLGLDQLCDK